MLENTAGFLPEALVLDVAEIDLQHEALFARLASLKKHCLATHLPPCGQADELLAALDEHFATEEQLAKRASISFAQHAWKHQEMTWILTKAFREVREGRREVFSLLRYVEYLFERHISEEDLFLSSCLCARPPAQAEAVRHGNDPLPGIVVYAADAGGDGSLGFVV